jgi:hypothetical protein
MAHLIACIGNDSNIDSVNKIISSKMFDKVYVVGGLNINYHAPNIAGVHVNVLKINFSNALEEIVPELYVILKRNFTQDKVQDLDIAVNISSGTGKEHSVVISTLMKLGYGIRLVDLDKHGNILDMI